jgi:hypothetical protein
MLKSPNQLVTREAQQGINPVVCSSCVMATTDEAAPCLPPGPPARPALVLNIEKRICLYFGVSLFRTKEQNFGQDGNIQNHHLSNGMDPM